MDSEMRRFVGRKWIVISRFYCCVPLGFFLNLLDNTLPELPSVLFVGLSSSIQGMLGKWHSLSGLGEGRCGMGQVCPLGRGIHHEHERIFPPMEDA